MPNSFTLRDLATRGLPWQQQGSQPMTMGGPSLYGPPVTPQMPNGWGNAPTQMPAQAGTHPAFMRPQPVSILGQPAVGAMPGPAQPQNQMGALLQMILSQQRR